MLKNAPPGWKIEAAKQIYSNDFIKLFEDTLDLNGEEKIYTRAICRNYSTIVMPHICSYHYFHKAGSQPAYLNNITPCYFNCCSELLGYYGFHQSYDLS